MKVSKLYRLAVDEYSMPRTDCYTSKEEALEELEKYKELLREEDYMGEGFEFGTSIILQVIDLNDLEDDYFGDEKVISEWVLDKDFTYSYQKDMAEKSIITAEVFGMWEDKEL